MSSRLFQNVREKRGLAYAVFSGLSAYRDAGNLTIYAGCANEAVDEVIGLCVDELRQMKQTPVPEAELRRAKDHLKGSLMLSLENTASRMSHLARQEIYFDRHFGLDETLAGVERVTSDGRAARGAGPVLNGSLAATVLGPKIPDLPREKLDLGLTGAIRDVLGTSSCRPTTDFASWRRTERLADWTTTMIPRYTNPEMGAIWSEQRRYETWLEVELAATDAMAEAGLVPADAARELRAEAAFDIARIEAIEQVTQHDVIAFTTAVAEQVGPARALAALRPHLLRRRRYRAGDPDARGVRPDRQGASPA